MGKRGVSKIEGPSTIKLGEEVDYIISRVYRKEDIAKGKYAQWILYVEESGKWRELKRHPNLPPKIGDTTTLVITNQNLVGKRLLLEAYMYSPEKTAPPGIIIKVEKGGEKKIEDIQLLMVDEKTPITKNTEMKYGQSILVKVQSVNMQKEKVTIYLYEDDVQGKGHSVKNEKNLVDQVEKTFDDNGLITHTFKLPIDFSKIANAYLDGEKDLHHEYYIHVKSKGFSQTSANVKVLNPEYIYQGGMIEEVVLPVKVKAKGVGADPIPNTGKSVSVVEEDQQLEKKEFTCEGKFCIKKGDKNELIREVNIRLAGFGGNVPTDEFTERTEKMIKQFQRDYMKVPETGKICGNVLRAIDEFGNTYSVDINEAKCPCRECEGFGKGLFSKEKNDPKILEKKRKYEYPGIHRTLIWVEKAVKFYLANQEKDKKLRVGIIYSGYRCNANNIKKGRSSTNHMGKALDLHIYGLSNSSNTEASADIVRDLLVKYTKAEYRWGGKNVIALEPSTRNRIGNEFIATTWVHYDVRTFELKYLKDEYFVKDNSSANGESILQLALRMELSQTCNCLGGGKLENNQNSQKKEDQRVDPKTLKASDKIVEFIKDWEKYSKMPYNDSKGYCTIGYGHLIKKKKCGDIVMPSEFKDGISEEQATELFRKDLKEFELAVQRDVTVKLYQREFDALVDLLFNCGQYFLKNGKAPKLYSNLLDEKYEEAAKEFLDIENRKRRQQNYEIFINGNYDSKH